MDTHGTGRLRIGARAVALSAVVVFAAACGGSALGFDTAPASLSPDSPRLAAVNMAFDQADLAVPASKPFILVFENRENLSHNVSVYADVALQQRLFEGVLFNGPATRWYPIPALAPGTYVFVCDLHPTMTGRLVAS